MSKEEQAIAIGRLIEEYGASKARITAMRTQSRRHGETMMEVALMVLQGHASAYRNESENARGLPTGEELAKMLSEISTEADRLESLGKQIGNLGLDLNEEFLGPLMPSPKK